MCQQFLADSNDCYYLTRNAFDGGAVNRYFESTLATGNNQALASQAINQPLGNVDWQENAFMLGLSLEHNGDSAHGERMISGLNTCALFFSMSIFVMSATTGVLSGR